MFLSPPKLLYSCCTDTNYFSIIAYSTRDIYSKMKT